MDSIIELHPAANFVLRGNHLSYYLAIVSLLILAYAIQNFLQSSKLGKIQVPFYKVAKTKWMFDAENCVLESYNRFRDRVYQIRATEGVQVLIPPNVVGEIKGLPETILSSTEAVAEAMMSKYTNFCLGHNGDLLNMIVRTRLSQNLARLVPKLKGEVEHVFATEFLECGDWTPVKVQAFTLRVIARVSGRAFVGPSINQNEQWIDATTNFAVHVFVAVVKLQFIPSWLRPVGQFLVSELSKIRQDVARARDMLQPIIDERLRDMETPGYEQADDLIQWLIESLPEAEKRDYQAHAELQLVLSAASIHTTNNLVTDCIFDLAARPDVQEMLRQEAYEILEVEGGWARKESMARLKKLDSFMRETQRLAGNVTSFIRKVLQPINLSDGTHLPAGTKLLAPQAGISHDERFYPDPEVFDALRFYKMRQKSDEDSNRWQFTTIGDINMNFGAGKHACPGRFFAGNEIKMILAFFLINYDMKLKDGEGRPRPMMVMMSKTPDPNGEVLFRRRTVQQ